MPKKPVEEANLRNLDYFLREKMALAVDKSYRRWKMRSEQELPPEGCITFLGTGGNPEALLSQSPRTAGFILRAGSLHMMVDPGPLALSGALESGIDLGTLDAIYISHGHVDHYQGAEPLVEAMCWGMSTRRGILLGPKQALVDEQLVSSYHQGKSGHFGYPGGPEVQVIKAGEKIQIKDVIISPVPVYHGRENYGFILSRNGFKMGYTSDTGYICTYLCNGCEVPVQRGKPLHDLDQICSVREDLKETFGAVDVLVANVTSHNLWAHRHLTTLGLAHLLKGTGVKLCLLSHFNYICLHPRDVRQEMARYVQEVSGVPTIPAEDLATYDLKPYGLL